MGPSKVASFGFSAHGSRITSCSRIYASDLKRAHHTAQIYANALGCEVWQEGRVLVFVCFLVSLKGGSSTNNIQKHPVREVGQIHLFRQKKNRHEEHDIEIIAFRILGWFHEESQLFEGCSHLMLAFQCISMVPRILITWKFAGLKSQSGML